MSALIREIRDPVHGFIECSSVEIAVVNTLLFQRLRRIKQLALACLVYPGALHTRFEHSLGVMHLAGKLYRRLLPGDRDPEELRTVRLAALLHDVGHGPFSHVSESVLERYYDNEKVKPRNTERIHELVTQALIEKSEELIHILGEGSLERIVGLLSGNSGDKVLRSIICGPLDADKLDYLLRDSYYCGVKYGVYDIDRLLSTCLTLRDNRDIMMAVSGDGLHSIEQFILAKYYMATQVYRHRVRLITDAMIVRGLCLGISVDREDFLERLYRFDGQKTHLDEWVKWDDDSLMNAISRLDDKTYVHDMFSRLRERRLFKRIYHERLNMFAPIVRARLSDDQFERCQSRLEAEVAETIGVDPHLVIAHRYMIQSAREPEEKAEGYIPIVVHEDQAPVEFGEASTLFQAIGQAQRDEYLDFYAPVTYEDEADKRRKEHEWRESIGGIVDRVLGANPGGGGSGGEGEGRVSGHA